MATKKKETKPKQPPLPPLSKQGWRASLRATSFAEGVKEADRYVRNAEANAKKAGVHPVDPDRFLDVKYSSMAGQYAYIAAMVLMDGFVADMPEDRLSFRPATFTESHKVKYGTVDEAEKANRQVFQAKGMNSRHAYAKLLRLSFSESLHDLFEAIHGILHETVHYKQEDSIETYESGIRQLRLFKAEFTKEAKKLLKAAGVAV